MAVTITEESGCMVYTVAGNDSFKDQQFGEKGVEVSGTFTEVTETLPGGTVAARTISADEAYLSKMGVSEFNITGTTTVIKICPIQQQVTHAARTIQ